LLLVAFCWDRLERHRTSRPSQRETNLESVKGKVHTGPWGRLGRATREYRGPRFGVEYTGRRADRQAPPTLPRSRLRRSQTTSGSAAIWRWIGPGANGRAGGFERPRSHGGRRRRRSVGPRQRVRGVQARVLHGWNLQQNTHLNGPLGRPRRVLPLLPSSRSSHVPDHSATGSARRQFTRGRRRIPTQYRTPAAREPRQATHIFSTTSIPSRSSPWRIVRAVRSQSSRRLVRSVSFSALRTGHAS